MSYLGDSGLIVPSADDPDDVLGYLREGVQEGDNFLRRQKGYLKIDVTQRMVMGEFGPGGAGLGARDFYGGPGSRLDTDDVRSSDLSQITDNELGSIALQIQAMTTDTRPFFRYNTLNPSLQAMTHMLNGCAQHWWLGRQIDMRYRDGINMCSAGASACLWTTWNPMLGPFGDFETRVIDARDALPVRPWSYHSYQDCEILVIRQERSTSELRRRWPAYAHKIAPDRDGSSAVSDAADTYTSQVINQSPFARYKAFINKARAAMSGGEFPVTDLYTAYIHDWRRNRSDRTAYMGPWDLSGAKPRPLRNWSYEAEPGDLLYPGGRVIVATNQCVLYDGPNNYWHDQRPASKLTLIQWPFPDCYLGKAPLWDITDWQRELNESQRRIADHCNKFVEPDVVIDQNSGISRASAEKIRTRKAGGKFFKRPGPGDGFRFEYPPALPAEVLSRPDVIISRMRSLAQVFDMQSVLNKGQLPANETMDAVLSMQTAGVRLWSRTIESFMREMGYQMAFNFCQYYTKARRLSLLGPRGAIPQDFDIDPSVLVPQFAGDDYASDGSIKPERLMQPRGRRSRARDTMRYISLDIRPNSMLRSAHVDEEMRDLQLARGGFIDPITMLEHMEYPNIGQNDLPGGDPGTVVGRLVKMSQLNMMGQVSAAGRKASGENPPQLKSSGAISETT